jgi:hypothetical protein
MSNKKNFYLLKKNPRITRIFTNYEILGEWVGIVRVGF